MWRMRHAIEESVWYGFMDLRREYRIVRFVRLIINDCYSRITNIIWVRSYLHETMIFFFFHYNARVQVWYCQNRTTILYYYFYYYLCYYIFVYIKVLLHILLYYTSAHSLGNRLRADKIIVVFVHKVLLQQAIHFWPIKIEKIINNN